MDWEVLLATFGMLFLAELGDKTQLAVVAQVCRLRRPAAIFLGGALGLILATGLGVLAGQAVGQVVPVVWIQRVAAAGFVIMGGLIAWQARRSDRQGQDEICPEGYEPAKSGRSGWPAFGATFLLLTLAEMGDKTQLATVMQASQSGAPWAVFTGAALALTAVTALGVVGGQAVMRLVPERWLRWLAAAAFIVMGVLIGWGIL